MTVSICAQFAFLRRIEPIGLHEGLFVRARANRWLPGLRCSQDRRAVRPASPRRGRTSATTWAFLPAGESRSHGPGRSTPRRSSWRSFAAQSSRATTSGGNSRLRRWCGVRRPTLERDAFRSAAAFREPLQQFGRGSAIVLVVVADGFQDGAVVPVARLAGFRSSGHIGRSSPRPWRLAWPASVDTGAPPT